MKSKMLLLFALFLGGAMLSATAQSVDSLNIPEVVLRNFSDSNQTASDIKWKAEGENFRVKYEIGDQDCEAVYSPLGNKLSSIKELNESMLPDSIINDIKRQFPDYKVDDIDEVTVGQFVTYKIELDGTPDVDVWYDNNGKFLRKVYKK